MTAPRPLRVLLVEDDEDDARLLALELRRAGFAALVERVETAEEMSAGLARGGFDIVISDYRLPGFGASEALELHKGSGLDVPFLVCSGSIGETQAVVVVVFGESHHVSLSVRRRLLRSPSAGGRSSVRMTQGRAARSCAS